MSRRLFRMIGQMREIVSTAQKATRKGAARREIDASISANGKFFSNQHAKHGRRTWLTRRQDNQPPAKTVRPDLKEW